MPVDIEQTIRDRIRHRIAIAGGSCNIGVRNLAKQIARDAGLNKSEPMKNPHRTPRALYTLVDAMMKVEGGILFTYGNGGTKYRGKRRQPISSRVYSFVQSACPDCEEEHLRPLKHPNGVLCASCGCSLDSEVVQHA